MRILNFFVTIGILSAAMPAATIEKIKSLTPSVTVDYNVTCSPKWMIVVVSVNSSSSLLYLERLKMYPGCEPERVEGKAIFRLPLDNIYSCGTTRMVNKLTGMKIYYHRIIIEEPQEELQMILVTCSIPPTHNTTDPPNTRGRRNVLPENFAEPDYVNITKYIEARAPVPYLNLAVRQQGRIMDTTLNVQPGTPLEMLIYLDQKSSDTYGLLASYLKVTDNSPEQEEVIIMNGCSIDPYIFGNFQSLENGDSLAAKFRAFKFPDENYVLFVGTVSVCLQQCRGIPCGNGQQGFGRRRRRAVPTDLPPDANKVFEVEMTTFLKVQYAPQHFKLNKGSLENGFNTQDKESPNQKQVAAFTQSSAISHQFTLSVILWLLLPLYLLTSTLRIRSYH